MPTSTSRLDLLQPIGSDAVSELRIAITANATGLDGAVIVTQGTVSGRPTNGSYVGQTYYATDTGLWYFWTGSAWQTVMLAGALSEGTVSSRPSAGAYVGQTYYATDITTWYVWTGSAWRTVLVAGPWQSIGAPGSGGATYFSGWTGTIRARQEGDVVRLSGVLSNNGGSGSAGSGCFVIPFSAPTEGTEWFTQVKANANPVLFNIASGIYGTTVEIDPYSEDQFAATGFVSFEGCTYTIS